MHLLDLFNYQKMQIHHRKVSMQIFKLLVYITYEQPTVLHYYCGLSYGSEVPTGLNQTLHNAFMYAHYACVH